MKAAILSIGDELTLGQVVDTNAAWLSARLIENGVITAMHLTVPDEQPAIVAALRQLAEAAEMVIVSGGLGPTPDDLTRAAMAEALGTELVENQEARAQVEDFFRQRQRAMPAANLLQALVPRGAHCLKNPIGTAPGIRARLGCADIFVLPGVPREMQAMYALHIEPELTAKSGRVILTARLDVYGMGESQVAEVLGELMNRQRNPLVGTTAAEGVISVRIRADFSDLQSARTALAATVAEARRRLGNAVFGDGSISLAAAVGDLLRCRGACLATAESCTGGLLGKMLTDIPGASKFYRGGWVVYDNALKISQLGVPANVLENEGAVSESVARCLAEGALRIAGTDYALAITGIAGPDGGTPEKPVGMVWLALAERCSTGKTVRTERFFWPGARESIRLRAAQSALNMLRLHLLSAPV